MRLLKPCHLMFMFAILFYSANSLAEHCTLSTSPMSFPPYDALNAAPVQTSGELVVMCDPPIVYSIKIGPGLNATGDFSKRQMFSAQATTPLYYNLFLDANFSRIWGDGSGFSDFYSGTGNGRLETLRIYGRITPAQRVDAGIYTDTVVITVEW